MPAVGQTALVLLAPEAETALAHVASVYPQFVRPGLPAHVTILYPWLTLDEVDSEVLHRCAELVAPLSPIEVIFSEVRTEPGFVYLNPDPVEPIQRVCDVVEKTWPALLPYGGKHKDAQPHVTLALGDIQPSESETLQDLIDPLLPIRTRFGSLHVVAFDGRGWSDRHRFQFGDSHPR